MKRLISQHPTQHHYPNAEELYALELEARRLRAQAMSEAFVAGAAAVRSLFARAVAALSAKVVRHA